MVWMGRNKSWNIKQYITFTHWPTPTDCASWTRGRWRIACFPRSWCGEPRRWWCSYQWSVLWWLIYGWMTMFSLTFSLFIRIEDILVLMSCLTIKRPSTMPCNTIPYNTASTYCHVNFLRAAFSMVAISYDVTQTSLLNEWAFSIHGIDDDNEICA